MKKMKMSAEDRLSELPDSLIFDIFRLLPMTDVVRTTILSKRWKNLWTTLPWLSFSNSQMMFNADINKFRSFVDGAINSWRGTKILRFHVSFHSQFIMSSFSADDLDSWIHFAMDKRVQMLALQFLPNASHVQYLMPQHLYSCSSLKSLYLAYCDLEIHGNVEWIHLERLTIHGGDMTENAINQVLAGSPKLAYLNLNLGGDHEKLSIRSSSLKWLCIEHYGYADSGTELRISTPNLRTLQILGVPYSKCLLMDVSSLIRVWYKLDGEGIYETDFFGERLSLILPTLQNVQRVTLSQWCIKMLGAAKKKHKLPTFPNAYFLVAEVWYERYELVLDVFEMFPKLKYLVIETTLKGLLKKLPKRGLKFERNDLSDLLLLQLRKIRVIWRDGDDSIFPLIQILLKHARNLQKLEFLPKGNKSPTSWRSLFLASRKLLKMQRASPTAKLIFRRIESCLLSK